MTNWHITSDLQHSTFAQDLQTLDACFALDGKLITKDPISEVTYKEQNQSAVYIKRYERGGKYLRRYVGRSRARAEWENLLFFQQLGIPTPTLLAYGEETKGLQSVRGALVTQALTEASDLENLITKKPHLLRQRSLFRHLAKQIAQHTQRLHSQRFTHNDLDWRNILVTQATSSSVSDAKIFFFDSPGGRFWIWPFLERRMIKDLAHLEKIARLHLPLRWRLWFYHQYTGRRLLTDADKKRIRAIARYCDDKGWAKATKRGKTATY